MSKIIIVPDLVEANGKTVRENNHETPHVLPIGSLVEITTDCPIGQFASVYKGVRLFVVAHTRDCDGSPLYSLSFDRNARKELDSEKADFEENKDVSLKPLLALSLGKAEGAISDGWDAGSLLLIDASPSTRD